MEVEKIIDDLCLIDNVVVNYSQGRRRGLTDKETEDRALKAVSLAIEILEELAGKYIKLVRSPRIDSRRYLAMAAKNKTRYITAEQYRSLKTKYPGRKEQPETGIRRAIVDFLRVHGWKVVRLVQSPLSEKGIPDLVAIRCGQTVWIEVKTPKGRLSAHQQAWLQDLEEHGGWWIVARSVEDVKHLGPSPPEVKLL